MGLTLPAHPWGGDMGRDTQRNYPGGVVAAAGSAHRWHKEACRGVAAGLVPGGGFESGAGRCWGRPSATPTSSSCHQDVRGAGLEPSPRVAGRYHQVAGKSPQGGTSTRGPPQEAGGLQQGAGGLQEALEQPPPLGLLSLPCSDLHLRDQNQPHGLGAHGLPDQGAALLHRHQGQVGCGHRGWDGLRAPPGTPSRAGEGEGGCGAMGVGCGGCGMPGGMQGVRPAPSEPAARPVPSCEITTREYCEFMHGYFHEEATLCSQVRGASGGLGARGIGVRLGGAGPA